MNSMNTHDSSMIRLRDLLIKALEGEADQNDITAINRILKSSPRMMRFYSDFIDIHLALNEFKDYPELNNYESFFNTATTGDFWADLAELERTAPPQPQEEPNPIPPPARLSEPIRPIKRQSFMPALLSFAALLILILYIEFNPRNSIPTVARITKAQSVQWTDNFPDKPGALLRQGETRYLLTGFVELSFVEGARVVVEGPARFQIESEDRIFLEQGKLTARIAGKTNNFLVRTPNATVVDYGTEFGVEVLETGQTSAHVYEGTVDLRAGTDPVYHGASLKLTERLSGQIDSSGTVQSIPFDGMRFTRDVPAPYQIATMQLNPLFYLRSQDNWRKTPANLVTLDGIDYQYQGDIALVAGPPLGGNRTGIGIKLENDQDTLRFDNIIADPRKVIISSGFSISFWIKPGKPQGKQLIMSQIPGNAPRYLIFNESGQIVEYLHNLSSTQFVTLTPLTESTWCHVVCSAVKDGGKYFYINGQKASTEAFAGDGANFFNSLYLGLLPTDISQEPDLRRFTGAVSEIAFFDRPLTEEEIRRLYQSALE